MSEPSLPTPIDRLLGPAEPEIDCDQCFAAVDHYVELQLAGHDADAAVPGMAAHLRGCPACSDEHESLIDLLRQDSETTHSDV